MIEQIKQAYNVLAYTQERILAQEIILAVTDESAKNKLIQKVVTANQDIDLDTVSIVVRPF